MNKITAFSKNRLMQRIKSGAGCGTISACRNYDDDFLASLNFDELVEFYSLDEDQKVLFALQTQYCVKNHINTPQDFNRYVVLKPADNKARTESLKNDLKKLNSLGVGFVKIAGVYEGSSEASFFVFNYGDKINDVKLKKELIRLGKKYSQDSITFSGDGETIDLICTTPFEVLYATWCSKGTEFICGETMESWNCVRFLETTISKITTEDGKVKKSELNNFPAYSHIASVPFAFYNRNVTASRIEETKAIKAMRLAKRRELARNHIASKHSSTSRLRAYGKMMGVRYE